MNRWIFGNQSLLTGIGFNPTENGPFGIMEIRERHHSDQGKSSWQGKSFAARKKFAAQATERAIEGRTENVHLGFHSSKDVADFRKTLGRLQKLMEVEEAKFAAEEAKKHPANWEEVKAGSKGNKS